MILVRALEEKMTGLWPHLDERGRRLLAASEARQWGHGGVSAVSRLCGLSRVTITKGLQELDAPPLPPGRVRRAGGGRPLMEAVRLRPHAFHGEWNYAITPNVNV